MVGIMTSLMNSKKYIKNPIKLDINYSILKKMGANFIISSVAIDDNNLRLIYQKNDNYYKRFYLYK